MLSYIIKPGVFLFKNALRQDQIEDLITDYSTKSDFFYKPTTKFGKKMTLSMMCQGWHWDASDYQYYRCRTDADRKDVEEFPTKFNNIVKDIASLAFPKHNSSWDIAIWNYYKPGKSKLGIHVDNSESSEEMNKGTPVVSISLGASCIFQIGGLKRNDPIENIKLCHGDVLLFGGPNRMIYHGVSKVLPYDKDDSVSTLLKGGRLNITLRKM